MTARELLMAVIAYGYHEREYGYSDALVTHPPDEDDTRFDRLFMAAADEQRRKVLEEIYDEINRNGDLDRWCDEREQQ